MWASGMPISKLFPNQIKRRRAKNWCGIKQQHMQVANDKQFGTVISAAPNQKTKTELKLKQ